jgi:deoxyribonuclease IV
MSTSGGAWKALERGRSIHCEIVQIFVKNNMRWFGRPPSPQEVALYANELARNCFSCVFGHAGYLINLAAPDSEKREKSIKSLILELQIATELGLPFLVMHPGAHLGSGEKSGFKQIASGLDEVFAATKYSPVRVALENTAGQGTCMGDRMEHLNEVYQHVQTPGRLGICLDTAHLFAAGYDIRTEKGWREPIRRIERLVGLKQILAFHLNDSKTELGSHVDRHAHIGHGRIGLEGFRLVVNDPRFKKHPGCLETPKSDDLREDVENLDTLRSLAITE